jgi:very-short-patch-repair endonuclease
VVHLSSACDNSDDPRLWELAAGQHGVVSWEQLRALGYGKRMVHMLVARGWLHRLSQGVYAVGHTRLSVKGQWMAAALAGGEGAALSHAHAAALHDLRTTPSGLIDVTAPRRRHVAGVRSHRARTLDRKDVTVVDAIPVTTVARTLLDQAERLSPQRLRTLLEAALRRDLFDLAQITATIARNPGRHGIARLTEALTDLADEAPWTQSEKERRFLELVRAHGLPEPSVNAVVLGDPVDFLWPAAKLIVEVDGWEFHKTQAVFEADRAKDARRNVAGYRVLRYTARRIDRDAPAVAAEISSLLSGGNVPAAASGR